MTSDPILAPQHGGEGWRGEIAATLALAWPLVVANLAQMLVYAVDVIFVARLGAETLAASSLAVSLFAAMFPVGLLADITNSGTLFAFMMVSIGVMVLRVREPQRPRPFRTPLVWIICPLAMLGCLMLFLNLGAITLKLFFGWAAIGLVVYFAYGRRKSHLANGTEAA